MCKVLIVEDEFLEQDFLLSIVKEYTKTEDMVFTCESGLEGIDLAYQHRPDIIFLDLMISELDGLSTLKEIREFLPDAYVIISTASSNFSFAQKALRLHAYDYLLKPVKPSDLRTLLNDIIPKTRSAMPSQIPQEEYNASDNSKKFVAEAIQYIQKHYNEKLALDIVASKVFISPKYLSQAFKSETGYTFTEYVSKIRIEHACELLLATNYPAYRISLETGFSDPSYFNRVFCSQMNMTPNAYRRNNQTNNSTKKA